MSYVNLNVVSAISEDVVTYLHTAKNIITITSAVSTSAIPIPAIPGVSAAYIITVPLFSAVDTIQYPYKTYSYADMLLNSATSAMKPFEIHLSAEDGVPFSANDISSNECMIYALSTGIINKLDNDNRLVYYDDINTSAFKWHLDIVTSAVTFNSKIISATIDLPIYSAVSAGHINTVNVIYSDQTSTDKLWKNADFSIDLINNKIKVIFKNDVNYIVPTISANDMQFNIAYVGTATATSTIVTDPENPTNIHVETAVFLPTITHNVTLPTSAYYVQIGETVDISKSLTIKTMYFYS